MSDSNNKYNVPSASIRTYNMLLKYPIIQNIRILFYFIDFLILLIIKRPKNIQNIKDKIEILVIHNIALGDSILWLSAAKQLRKLYPKEKYNITLACQGAFEILYRNEKIFDDFIHITNVSNVKSRYIMYKNIRSRYYNLILDPVGCENCTTNVFITRAAVGYKKIGIIDNTIYQKQCPTWMRSKIYTQVIKIERPNLHLIEYYAEFIKGIGGIEYIIKPAELTPIEYKIDITKKYYIIFPTASISIKRWSLKRFAQISEKIYKKTNLSMLVCGTTHDKQIIDEFISQTHDIPIIDYTGKTNILEFIELIRNASFVVTNDTSAFHIAVATRTPVTIISGGYTYNRYTKYNNINGKYINPTIVIKEMSCFNCNNKCKYKNIIVLPCIENITMENAWSCINNMIDKEVIINGL